MFKFLFETDFLLFVFWFAAIYGGIKYYKHRKYHKDDVRFFRIYAGVHDLQQIGDINDPKNMDTTDRNAIGAA